MPDHRTPRDRPPKICFVGLQNLPVLSRDFGHFSFGGAQVQQVLVARALRARGFDVSMILLDYGQEEDAAWYGIRTLRAYRPAAGWPGLRFLHPRWSGLWSAMRRADADVYYLSCAGAQLGQAALYTRLTRRKLIYRVASDADCDPKLVLIQFARDRQLYAFGLRRADAILAQSAKQQANLRRNYDVDSVVTRSLVEADDSKRDFDARDIDVLWVSNILQLKRPELLFELARRLPRARVHMVGGLQPAHESVYESVLQMAATAANVVHHGRVAYQDMPDLYGRARVVVNTSDIEGFPNAYLQAWRRGTPTVAFFDPDGIIAANRLGHAARDFDDMVQAVGQLMTDRQAWQQASERCRHFMKREFDDDRLIAPYVEAIAGLLGEPTVPAAARTDFS